MTSTFVVSNGIGNNKSHTFQIFPGYVCFPLLCGLGFSIKGFDSVFGSQTPSAVYAGATFSWPKDIQHPFLRNTTNFHLTEEPYKVPRKIAVS